MQFFGLINNQSLALARIPMPMLRKYLYPDLFMLIIVQALTMTYHVILVQSGIPCLVKCYFPQAIFLLCEVFNQFLLVFFQVDDWQHLGQTLHEELWLQSFSSLFHFIADNLYEDCWENTCKIKLCKEPLYVIVFPGMYVCSTLSQVQLSIWNTGDDGPVLGIHSVDGHVVQFKRQNNLLFFVKDIELSKSLMHPPHC